jgi:hypothetical protein
MGSHGVHRSNVISSKLAYEPDDGHMDGPKHVVLEGL